MPLFVTPKLAFTARALLAAVAPASMLAVLAAASTADVSCAACSGTCNLVTGECSCPITHSGPDCEQPLLPACTSLGVTLRPMFWLHRVTREGWRRHKQPVAPSAMGALPCECIQQMLRLAALYRSKWVDVPSAFVCSAATLVQLLQAPEHVEWLNLTATFSEAARTYKFSARATERAPAVEAISAQLQGRPLPSALCSEACGGMGWCVQPQPHARRTKPAAPSCRCFPEAVPSQEGSCVRVDRFCANANGNNAAPANQLCAARGVRTLPSTDAATAVSFNAIRCPRGCGERGSCDLQGFCLCARGFSNPNPNPKQSNEPRP